MIVDQRYPTQSSIVVNTTQEPYTDEFSASMGAIQPTDLSAYWLGWVKKENIPLSYQHNKATVTETSITFENDTSDANQPCGYCFSCSDSQTYKPWKIIEDSTYNAPTYTGNLVNELYPEYSGLATRYGASSVGSLVFAIYEYDLGENPVNLQDAVTTFSTHFYSAIEFYKFLSGDDTIVKTLGSGSTYAVDIKPSDVVDGKFYKKSNNENYYIRGILINYNIYDGRPISPNTNTPINAMWTCKVEYDNHSYIPYGTSGSAVEAWGFARKPKNGNTLQYLEEYISTIKCCRGGAEGTFNIDLLPTIKGHFTIAGNILCHVGQSWQWFLTIYTLEDVKKHMCLQYRLDSVPNGVYTPSYVAGVTYATDVSEDDEFLATFKTGDITNPAFRKTLRPWQYFSFTMDDFTEDDVPGGDEPGGDDDPGSDEPVETPTITGDNQELQIDRTLPAPTDFITLYVITPPILSRFGRTLWTSLADYNPQDPTSVEIYKNFFAILNEQVTGTLDISSVLNYVISVRQYPFDVSDLPTVAQAGNTITFGTGKLPIDCGSAAVVCTMSSTIGILDCGEVTIADYKDFKLYNDFRDYHNTTVTAFLPYCGTVELNPMETIHNTIHCYYAVDFYTGECTAYLTVTDSEGHKIIAGIKNGIIGVLLPITATNSGQLSGRHTVDNAMDSSLVTGFFGNAFGAVANIATGNVGGAANNIVGIANQQVVTRQMLQGEREGRSAVMSPSLSGGTGAAAFYQPAGASILVRRGTYARDKIKNYPQTCGYPATTSGTLSSFKGYTECYNVDVSGINCTDEEKSAIKALLETGVYL